LVSHGLAGARRKRRFISHMRKVRRETNTITMLVQCLGNKEIGAALDIAEDTVKIHIKNIFAKLEVMDRTQAVVSASQRGFIQLEAAQ